MQPNFDVSYWFRCLERARDWAEAHYDTDREAWREYVRLGAMVCYHARLTTGLTIKELKDLAEEQARKELGL